ncbi:MULTISPECIES: DUF3153 domain-containing protein [Cohnella]|uniref:DUF3153 domain-containing protein n=1 Tax=Cohnella TaxID=329857 RepID=UPI0009BA5641|nr:MULTISPECIES: DUF3153 domain-containing protein [Cohnella]MBN2980355.1 DUF3153 domain-containing protein [Cohnella algarum]
MNEHGRARKWTKLLALLVGSVLLLSSCAQGEAHVTINRNGTADLDLDLSVSKQILTAIGKADIMNELAERFEQAGMGVRITDRDGQAQIEASRRVDLREYSGDLTDLPEGIEVEDAEEKKWFYTKHAVAVTLDLAPMLEQGQQEWIGQLSTLPDLMKKLIQSQLKFAIVLTLPIKADGSNADEVTDGGRTHQWNVDLFEANRFELVVNVPNLEHIAYAVGALLLLFIIGGIYLYRSIRRRKTTRM